MWGSTLVADGKVYAGDEDGDFIVLAANKGKKLPPEKIKAGGPENEATVISQTNMGSPVYGTPIEANGSIYVQSNTHLFSLYDAAKMNGLKDQPARLDIQPKRP
jgi:outer membrane protein assembly factor BamB